MIAICSVSVHVVVMSNSEPFLQSVARGVLLARGVARHLRELGFVSLPEVSLPTGLRADVMALGPKGEVWIVECKSSRADFRTDAKWAGYLEWADRFFWAVDTDFPREILPPGTGIIVADAYGAEITAMPTVTAIAAARRKAMILRFASLAAARLQSISDPGAAVHGG